MRKTNWITTSIVTLTLFISGQAAAQQDNGSPQPPRELPPQLIQQSKEVVQDTVQPLTPDEILQVREGFNATQRATRNRYPDAKTVVTTQYISNKPGSEIPTLYAGVGYNTNIIFNDASGEPWPVVKASVGNQEAFGLDKIADHIWQVAVREPNSYSNISVLLDGMDAMLIVNVRPPEKTIDVSKTYVVNGQLSPQGQRSVDSQVASQRRVSLPINKGLNQFLDGLVPEQANHVPIQSGPETDIWVYDNQVIVKTQMKLTSPGTKSEPLYGANGWRVYAIDNPQSTMAFIRNGAPVLVTIAESAIAHLRN